MKQKLLMIAAAAMVAALASSSRAALYTDTTGDLFFSPSNPHMDITSVEVTNDFADVIFKINLAGDPIAVNWGKYCIGFVDTNQAAGDTSANGNGWGRSISLTQGMNYWIGTWVDSGGGAQFFNYSGGVWNGPGAASVSTTTSNITITVPMVSLNKAYGDSFDFDVYTTGGGGTDPAIDSLANPAQTVSSWSTPYASSLTKTYTLVVPPIPSTNYVKFSVNMEVPIWEFDNSVGNGFSTNTDTIFVRGSFNGWGTVSTGYQLFQVGGSPVYTNTVQVVQYINQSVAYKFQGVSFPNYESPALLCGNNRTLTITSQNMTAPLAYFSDRKLSDPIDTITILVDMSLQRMFGLFDPTANNVTMPGDFNGWNTGALTLTPGADPNTNIYSTTFTYNHYPTNACNIGNYKFYVTGSAVARDGGWEDPISTASGNRTFSINSIAQTNTYYYNDETPFFRITSAQQLSPDAVKINWQSFPSRNNVPTGGVYQVESRSSLTAGGWTSNGTVYSTTSSSTFTNTGLTGTNQQFYRVILKGLVP
jgi:hypothetical protein